MNGKPLPKIWPKSTVVILGGGPSVLDTDLDLVFSGRFRVIGVNHSFRLGPVDLLWFGDEGWYRKNRLEVADFAGLRATCCPSLPEEAWGFAKRFKRSERTSGIESCPGMVSWNLHSGGSAINMAYHLGAKRVALVGFDMRCEESGRHHWHGEKFYGKFDKKRPDPYPRFIKTYKYIAKDAGKLGLEILNSTPGSAIPFLPFKQLEEL